MSDDRNDHDEVGTVAEEAAKLLGALSGFAKEHGAGVGHGFADLAQGAAEAARNVNEHIATGAPECTYCPICRVVHVVRQCSPEVRTHLTVAATNLLQAAAALLATTIPADRPAAAQPSVEHIDLDDAPGGSSEEWGTTEEWSDGWIGESDDAATDRGPTEGQLDGDLEDHLDGRVGGPVEGPVPDTPQDS